MEISLQERIKLNPITEIPKQYLLSQIEPQNDDDIFSEIPIVDMASLLHEEQRSPKVDEFHSICRDWGIFQLVNHDVELEKLKKEIENFYEIPLEERAKFKIEHGSVEGYGQTVLHSKDQKVDWTDRFFMITNPVNSRKPHLFSELPPSLRENLEAYFSDLQKMCKALLGLIAEALDIDKHDLVEMFEDGMQSIRMNYYPPCPRPDKVHGLTPHSDGSGITVLLQVNDVEGFQVKKDGAWINVKILKGALVINLGDIMEILSNGIYKSVEHRATVNSEKSRMSIGMFFCPKFGLQFGPLPSLVGNKSPLFKRITMDQFASIFFSRGLNGKSFLEHMKV